MIFPVGLAALVALTLGCEGTRIARPEAPPPAIARPAEAIPGDLDVALRVDMSQARRVFGARFHESLELRLADPEGDPAGARLLADALERADTVWIALRPGLAPELTDNVTIVRGKLGDLRPRRYGGAHPWGPPRDLGADYRVFARPPTGRRAAPVRLYARSSDLMVFVSEAEIDSTERSVELRAGDPHVEPPERGTVSLAARLPPLMPLVAPRFPALAEALGEATDLTGHATIDGLGLRAVIEVKFVDHHGPKRAGEAARQIARIVALDEGPFGLVARATRLDVVERTLVLRVSMDPETVGSFIACADGTASCAPGVAR